MDLPGQCMRHEKQMPGGLARVPATAGLAAHFDTEDYSVAPPKPTHEDVKVFMALKKAIVRQMEWVDSPSKKATGWSKFESKCFVGFEISEEIDFRASYRRRAIDRRGGSEIEIPEAFYVSIWIRNHRIRGFDTNPDQKHTNAVVAGRPYSGVTVTSHTHEHIWTVAADDYVEPVEPPILELEDAIAKFCDCVNLFLNGPFKHPLKGQTEQLL